MNKRAGALKIASHTIGAGKIYYACYYIQEAYREEYFIQVAEYYPLLVEAIIEVKRYIR